MSSYRAFVQEPRYTWWIRRPFTLGSVTGTTLSSWGGRATMGSSGPTSYADVRSYRASSSGRTSRPPAPAPPAGPAPPPVRLPAVLPEVSPCLLVGRLGAALPARLDRHVREDH